MQSEIKGSKTRKNQNLLSALKEFEPRLFAFMHILLLYTANV